MENKYIIGEDNICPVLKIPCGDECCPPGAECNLTPDDGLNRGVMENKICPETMVPCDNLYCHSIIGCLTQEIVPEKDEYNYLGWTKPENILPELKDSIKVIPILVVAMENGHPYRKIAYYFPDRYKTIEFDDWDYYDPKDYPYTEEDTDNEVIWLRAGFYEDVFCNRCESTWRHLQFVTHWQYLPDLPKENI